VTQLEELRAQVAVARQAHGVVAVDDDHQGVRVQGPAQVESCQGEQSPIEGGVGRESGCGGHTGHRLLTCSACLSRPGKDATAAGKVRILD
jgi:hypothetical protein